MLPEDARPEMWPDALSERLMQTITLPVGRPSAVLVLLYPTSEGMRVALTRRSEDLERHKGQISFPGGACDPEDADYWHTALREAEEEVALAEAPRLLGYLPPLSIPVSGFAVAPCVGYLPRRPAIRPATAEVTEVLEPVLRDLWALEDWETRRIPGGGELRMPFYPWRKHRIWGATARMLRTLRDALDT